MKAYQQNLKMLIYVYHRNIIAYLKSFKVWLVSHTVKYHVSTYNILVQYTGKFSGTFDAFFTDFIPNSCQNI